MSGMKEEQGRLDEGRVAKHAQLRAERERLRAQSPRLFEGIAAILFRHDPTGINFDFNPDEYEPEAASILPRLATAHSAADVKRTVREELEWWFGDGISDRSFERADAAAEEIWGAWQDQRAL
jgi:hypothetical protein